MALYRFFFLPWVIQWFSSFCIKRYLVSIYNLFIKAHIKKNKKLLSSHSMYWDHWLSLLYGFNLFKKYWFSRMSWICRVSSLCKIVGYFDCVGHLICVGYHDCVWHHDCAWYHDCGVEYLWNCWISWLCRISWFHLTDKNYTES